MMKKTIFILLIVSLMLSLVAAANEEIEVIITEKKDFETKKEIHKSGIRAAPGESIRKLDRRKEAHRTWQVAQGLYEEAGDAVKAAECSAKIKRLA